MKEQIPDTIQSYYKAWQTGDFSNVKFAKNFEFTGPGSYYNNADDYVNKNIDQALKSISSVDMKKTFVNGNQVCAIYDVITKANTKMPMVEWFVIEAGEISKINIYFGEFPTPQQT